MQVMTPDLLRSGVFCLGRKDRMNRLGEGIRRKLGNLGPAYRKNAALFLIGFFVGILFLNLCRESVLGEKGLFDIETLTGLKYTALDGDRVFSYVLKKRGGLLLLLTVMSTTYLGKLVCRVTVTWFGCSFGMMLAALTIRFGLKGQVLAIVWLFPHFLVYIPMAILFLIWCEDLYERIYHKKNLPTDEKLFLVWKTIQFLLFAAALCFGCLLEGYVGSRLLTGYLKVF